MKTKFELIDGRIFVTVCQPIWSYDSDEEECITISKEDITDKVMPVLDDYLDYHLELKDSKYAHENAKIKYQE
jgi:hypothetical protein